MSRVGMDGVGMVFLTAVLVFWYSNHPNVGLGGNPLEEYLKLHSFWEM